MLVDRPQRLGRKHGSYVVVASLEWVCLYTNLSAGLLLGLGEIMLGVCALGDREGVTRNNPTTDDNTSLGLDIYIISKTAHPSNTKPHHRKFQIPRRRRPPPP